MADDEPFLRQLYAARRSDLVGLPETIVDMQFDARRRGYQTAHPHANWSIVLQHGQPVGEVVVDRRPEEHRLVDISVLPEARGRGIGRSVIEEVLATAAAAETSVLLSVDRGNDVAQRLYRRLGFQVTGEDAANLQMAWHP